MPHDPAVAQQLALIRAGHGPTIRRVRSAMRRAGGNVDRAAEALGVSRSALFRWLQEPAFEGLARTRKNTEKSTG